MGGDVDCGVNPNRRRIEVAPDGAKRVVRVGIIGLGGAAAGMIGKFARNPRFKITGAADIDAEILGRFKSDFPEAEAHASAEGLCASKNIDFIYIGTPN